MKTITLFIMLSPFHQFRLLIALDNCLGRGYKGWKALFGSRKNNEQESEIKDVNVIILEETVFIYFLQLGKNYDN